MPNSPMPPEDFNLEDIFPDLLLPDPDELIDYTPDLVLPEEDDPDAGE